MALSIATGTRTNMMTQLNTAVGTSAKIKIYSGTRPANVGTALSGNTLLAQLTGNASAFGSVTNGVLTCGAITADSSADNAGTATFARISTSGDADIFDCSVGTSGADINFNTTSIAQGATVSITSWTLTDGNP